MTDVVGRGDFELHADPTALNAEMQQVAQAMLQAGKTIESAFGKQATAGVKQAETQVRSLRTQITGLIKSSDVKRGILQGLGLGAGFGSAMVIAQGINLVKDAIGGAINAAADLDAAMTESTAIMGDLSDKMRNDMTAAARQMAKESTFSATQAAESYFFLASAGLSAEQSLRAMPVVTRFAQAGAFDMAKATDLLTDAQSALGLTIRDNTVKNMENMIRVSDVLVKANILSNASVEQFSLALTNRAGAALRLVGKDVEEGAALLAAWADQGTKAEEAGTRLDIVLRDLQRAAIKNGDQFERFGIRVFDAQGEMRNMADIIDDFSVALDGMSDRERRATIMTLGFQDRSVAATTSLLGLGDAIRNYETQLRDAGGVTEEVADKQLESFRSQMALLDSAITDLGISVGQALIPGLLKIAQTIRMDVIPAIEELFAMAQSAMDPAIAVTFQFEKAWQQVTRGLDTTTEAMGRAKDAWDEQGQAVALAARQGLDVVPEYADIVALLEHNMDLLEVQTRSTAIATGLMQRNLAGVRREGIATGEVIEELTEEELKRLPAIMARIAGSIKPVTNEAGRLTGVTSDLTGNFRSLRSEFRKLADGPDLVDRSIAKLRKQVAFWEREQRRAQRGVYGEGRDDLIAFAGQQAKVASDQLRDLRLWRQANRIAAREAADQRRADRRAEAKAAEERKAERREQRQQDRRAAEEASNFAAQRAAEEREEAAAGRRRRREAKEQIEAISAALGVSKDKAREVKEQADKTFGKDGWRVNIDTGELTDVEGRVLALDGTVIDMSVHIRQRVDAIFGRRFSAPRPGGWDGNPATPWPTQHGGWRPAGAFTLSGEGGPELRIEPRSGLYIDAQKTARALEGLSRLGSGVPVVVNVNAGAFLGSHMEATRWAQSVAPVLGRELQRIGFGG